MDEVFGFVEPEVAGPVVEPEVDGPVVEPEVDGVEVDGPVVDGPVVDGQSMQSFESALTLASRSHFEAEEVQIPRKQKC